MPKSKEFVFKDEIDLMEYFRIIKKRKLTFFILTTFLFFVALIAFLTSPKIYEAKSLVRIGFIMDPLKTTTDTILSIQSERMLSLSAREIKNKLGVKQLKDMFNNGAIEVKAIPETNFIQITTRDKDPALSREISNAIAGSFVSEGKILFERNKRSVNEQIQTFQKQVDLILERPDWLTQELDIYRKKNKRVKEDPEVKYEEDCKYNFYCYAMGQVLFLEKQLARAEQFEILEPAVLPREPISTHILQRIIFILFAGLVVILFVVFFQEFCYRNL